MPPSFSGGRCTTRSLINRRAICKPVDGTVTLLRYIYDPWRFEICEGLNIKLPSLQCRVNVPNRNPWAGPAGLTTLLVYVPGDQGAIFAAIMEVSFVQALNELMANFNII